MKHRGNAEIELLICVIVLIGIILMVRGALQVGLARLATSESAGYQAFNAATAPGAPQYTDNADMPPLDGFTSIRPGFPNRVHVPTPSQNLTLNIGDTQSKPVTVGATATVPSPAWSFNGYPVGSDDYSLGQQWFEQYIDESHGSLVAPLGLAPAWTP